jgi:immune inhibitor A
MWKITAGLLGLTLATGTAAGFGGPAAVAAGNPSAGVQPPAAEAGASSDELPNPLEEKRRALRDRGLHLVLTGKAEAQKRGKSTVVKVGTEPAETGRSRNLTTQGTSGASVREDQYVELARDTTDRIFVVLAEFGNERHEDYPDEDTDPKIPGPERFDGPLHNEIPEPDRTVDNTTIWQPDYSADHFRQLYFGDTGQSVRSYYEKQSSGRYSVEGTVTDWVQVRYNEARYGRSNGFPCDANVCNNTWQLVRDAVDQWVADQRAAGRTDEQIRTELSSFDVWDRYDHDSDGDFNEPDGYIDHFQIVHSGGDQADGDPYQGEDAIWSHRWYAFPTDEGTTGPDFNKLGGTEIGETGLWVGDYTIQPENGGLGVFAHEYGHDLGLPDHYDTSGGGENSVNWWTLMAQSRVNAADDQAIGTRAADLGAWDKLQLGWLDYEVMLAGQSRTLDLGPHEYHTDRAQGVVVVLPKKQVTHDYGKPAAGEKMWWSTKGDNLATTMTRPLDLSGKESAALALKARYDIEADYDYLYIQWSEGGDSWTALDGTANGEPFVTDGSGMPAISGSSDEEWVDVEVPLDTIAGKNVQLRFLYRTDGGVAPDGFFADEITVLADETEVFTDGAESSDHGWTLKGFRATTGTEVNDYDNYHLASNRNYVSYDEYLATGPYNFGFLPAKPDWVERFSYQEGLLISYWDTSHADNNTSEHPGEGLILPIDAHPRPIYRLDGEPWRPRIAGYDAPFSLDRVDSYTLHFGSRPSYIRGQAAQPVFDDSGKYWFEEQPTAGVKVPKAGVRIKVISRDGTSMRIKVQPSPLGR